MEFVTKMQKQMIQLTHVIHSQIYNAYYWWIMSNNFIVILIKVKGVRFFKKMLCFICIDVVQWTHTYDKSLLHSGSCIGSMVMYVKRFYSDIFKFFILQRWHWIIIVTFDEKSWHHWAYWQEHWRHFPPRLGPFNSFKQHNHIFANK